MHGLLCVNVCRRVRTFRAHEGFYGRTCGIGGFARPLRKEVDIELGCLDAGVSEQFSDGTRIGTAIGGKACERMPEIVQTEAFKLGAFADFIPRFFDFGDTTAGFSANQIIGVVRPFRQVVEDGHGRRVEVDDFGAGLAVGEMRQLAVAVDVAAFQREDFGAPCAREHEQQNSGNLHG